MKEQVEVGKLLIEIIASVINQTPLVVNNAFDAKRLFQLAKFHSVDALLYYGLNDIDIPIEIKDKLKKINQTEIYKTAVQISEQDLILKALEKHSIKHMPLKGLKMKALAPSEDMRQMADLDILVDKSKLKCISKIMKELGYQVVHLGGNHDVYYKLPFMNVEMHRDMLDLSYKMADYYHHVWDKVKLIKGSQYHYEQTDDDFYIYMVAHAAKHFGNGGTGIRSIMDVYLFLKKYEATLNWDYITQEFALLNLVKFAENVKVIALKWFGQVEIEEDTSAIEAYIISSGTYGSIEHTNIMQGFMGEDATSHLASTKFKFLLHRLFPSVKMMKRRNPILQKCIVLLPWFYLMRLLKPLFKKKGFARKHIQGVTSIQAQDIAAIKEVKEKSGINP